MRSEKNTLKILKLDLVLSLQKNISLTTLATSALSNENGLVGEGRQHHRDGTRTENRQVQPEHEARSGGNEEEEEERRPHSVPAATGNLTSESTTKNGGGDDESSR